MGSGIEVLEGKTLTKVSVNLRGDNPVEKGAEEVYFRFSDGSTFKMYHRQDCCETVYLEDIIGCSLGDFVGETILAAYETSNHGEAGQGSETWTFYSLVSQKHFVTLRWYGTSNGYYSESVCVEQIT